MSVTGDEPIAEPATVDSDGGAVSIDEVSGRVLGCLIEKAMTTPDHYPMSLNAVVVACNQVSNRQPVVTYDEGAVELTLRGLADQGLAKMVHRPGDRVVKYRHAVDDVLGLTDQEMALLAVLMLRGPQTPGELRQRTIRYVDFATLVGLEEVLRSLQERDPSLAQRLVRQPGQKEYRYRQLMASEAAGAEGLPSTTGETEGVWRTPNEVDRASTEATTADDEVAMLRLRIEAIEWRLTQLMRELGIPDAGSSAEDVGDL